MLDFTENQALQVYAYLLEMRDKQEKYSLKWGQYNWKALGLSQQLKLEL